MRASRLRRDGFPFEHLVNQTVFLGFERVQEKVPVAVSLDFFLRPSGGFREDFVDHFADSNDFSRTDIDIGGLSLNATHNLMEDKSGVGEAESFSLLTRGHQHGAHAARLAEADGAYVGLDVLHRVVNRKSRGYAAPRRVDVEADVLVRVFRFQEEQLGDDVVRGHVVDGHSQEYDAVGQ